MIDRLLYPDHKQDRGPDPGPFQDTRYKEKYKPYLQHLFRRKCVYCRVPDTWRAETYEVEHYLPKSKRLDLEKVWSNLFYACSTCNQQKRVFVRQTDLFIPNPCDDIMAEHLQFLEADIEAFTPSGRFTVEQLSLNREDLRKLRKLHFRNILIAEEALKKDRKTLEDLQRQASLATSEVERARIEDDIIDLQAKLRDTAEHLETLTGEPVTPEDAGGQQL